MFENAHVVKVYVISNDTKYVENWEKSLRGSGTIIVGIDPKFAFLEMRLAEGVDIVIIDSSDFMEWKRDYLVQFILYVFGKKVVLMTNDYQEDVFLKAKATAHGYICKNGPASSRSEAILRIFSGRRCFYQYDIENWSLKYRLFFALRHIGLVKVYAIR